MPSIQLGDRCGCLLSYYTQEMRVSTQSLVLLLLASSLITKPAASHQVELTVQDAAAIEELYHLWSAEADSVWIGASKTKIPVLYIKSDTEYAIGFPEKVLGFVPVSGPSELHRSVQARPRILATDLSASFPVEGVAAVVIGSPELLKKSPEDWVLVAAHEMFHVFQAANGSYAKTSALKISPSGDPSWQLTFPFPFANLDVMRLIHLQGYTLWLTATSKDDEVQYNLGTALEAAQVYRTFLDRIGQPKDYSYSEFQEWNEGVAAYTQYRLAEAATQNYVPTLDFRTLPGFQGYAALWKQTYQNWPYLVKHAGRAARDRNAFYHLGMGKALALDKAYPAWKNQYFAAGIWLDDLLKTALEQRR
jgi:hypothetical protein